jgi:hypothetical protein
MVVGVEDPRDPRDLHDLHHLHFGITFFAFEAVARLASFRNEDRRLC